MDEAAKEELLKQCNLKYDACPEGTQRLLMNIKNAETLSTPEFAKIVNCAWQTRSTKCGLCGMVGHRDSCCWAKA